MALEIAAVGEEFAAAAAGAVESLACTPSWKLNRLRLFAKVIKLKFCLANTSNLPNSTYVYTPYLVCTCLHTILYTMLFKLLMLGAHVTPTVPVCSQLYLLVASCTCVLASCSPV